MTEKLKYPLPKFTIKIPNQEIEKAKKDLIEDAKTNVIKVVIPNVIKEAKTGAIEKVHEVFPIIDLREVHQKDQETSNRNSQLTDYLKQVVDHIRAEGTLTQDAKKKKNIPFRIRSIQKAIDILTNHPVAIKNGKEAQALPGIGAGIGKRIDEILTTGKLAELETIEDDYVRLIQELTKISGIGLVKAKKLIEEFQITGLDDLIHKYNTGKIVLGKNQLTHHQVIGIKYAKEIDQKIPRAEIDVIATRLQKELEAFDPSLMFEICGSYRRGKAISGDIDVLISRVKGAGETGNVNGAKETENAKGADESPLMAIVERLTESGLIVDHLTEAGQTKYMGICRLRPDSVARRIDIRFIPYQSWGAARLYFTGSGVFNQLFRAVALQRGFTISEYAVCNFSEGQKGSPIATTSEEDIFKLIGIKYLTPSEREF